jgi:hypothetical protein
MASRGSAQGLVDIKNIGKPERFTGKYGEWSDFKFKLVNYMTAVDLSYRSELEAVSATGTEILDAALASDDQRMRSASLYTVLASVCTGEALKICKKVRSGSGFETFRLMRKKYEPILGSRAIAMLQNIITPEFPKERDGDVGVTSFATQMASQKCSES